MRNSLSLVVILTSVLTGLSLVDAAEISDNNLNDLRTVLIKVKCVPWASENQLKKFFDCYNKSIKAMDSQGCKEGSEDISDECLNILDKNKIGDAKGIMAVCKANGKWNSDIERMNDFLRCITRIKHSLCPELGLLKVYHRFVIRVNRAKYCVKKH